MKLCCIEVDVVKSGSVNSVGSEADAEEEDSQIPVKIQTCCKFSIHTALCTVKKDKNDVFYELHQPPGNDYSTALVPGFGKTTGLIRENTAMKTLKEKVLACDKIFGTQITFSEPVIAEIFGHAGYDFLWIDTEHSAIDLHTLSMYLGCLKYTGTPAIVRVPMHDRNQVKKVLEMGADGIIFPMINTPEEADAAMKSCLYPPEGNRGFGPLRAQHYGFRDLQDYLSNARNEICRFVQVETETAVKNLPEIVKNPYIDGFIIGPFDLSGSIGELGNVFGKRNMALIEETISILKAHNKCIGISTGSADPEVFKLYADMGINMISTAGDLTFLYEGVRKNTEAMKKVFGR